MIYDPHICPRYQHHDTVLHDYHNYGFRLQTYRITTRPIPILFYFNIDYEF